MVRVIKRKSLFRKIAGGMHNFKLFAFLGVMTLVLGLTFNLVSHQQDLRQRASDQESQATLTDFWEGKAEWKLKSIYNHTMPDAPFHGVHIETQGSKWYMVSRSIKPVAYECGQGGNSIGATIRASTDNGATWTNPFEFVTNTPGTPWECVATDGDLFYNSTEDRWHYLFQCMGRDLNWNGCHLVREGSDPVGNYQAIHNNPVIKKGVSDLWNIICTDSSKDCFNMAGGNNVTETGTFNIIKFDGQHYIVSFHGYYQKIGYRGLAKTTDFKEWIAGDSSQGVPSDAVLDKNDQNIWRENWQGGPIGFGLSSTIEDNGYYYTLAEAGDIDLICTPGQNWDIGLFRTNSLTSTTWEQFPQGNPIWHSSKSPFYPDGKSHPCDPGYVGIFKDPLTHRTYMHLSQASKDPKHMGLYIYELLPSKNILKNSNLWSCSTQDWKWHNGINQNTNIVVYRHPEESSDGNCVMASNCGGGACDSTQSIYQEIPVDNQPRGITFGGKFSTYGGTGNLTLALWQFTPAGVLKNDTLEISANDNFQEFSKSVVLDPATTSIRYEFYLRSQVTYRADEMFVIPNDLPTSTPTVQPSPQPTTPPPTPTPTQTQIPTSSPTPIACNPAVKSIVYGRRCSYFGSFSRGAMVTCASGAKQTIGSPYKCSKNSDLLKQAATFCQSQCSN